MNIKVGDSIIPVLDIYAEHAMVDGKVRPTLRVSSDTAFSNEQIEALTSSDWRLYESDSEELLSTHKGYRSIFRYQAVFAQTETSEEREAALERRIAELEASKSADGNTPSDL